MLHVLHEHTLARVEGGTYGYCDGRERDGGCRGYAEDGGSGPRYRCTEGCDFDLCPACMEDNLATGVHTRF